MSTLLHIRLISEQDALEQTDDPEPITRHFHQTVRLSSAQDQPGESISCSLAQAENSGLSGHRTV
jgi:hypothetical protein